MMKAGEPSDGHWRREHYVDLLHHLHGAGAHLGLSDCLQQLREAKREEDDRFEELVEAWKASSKPISFDKWRSREVCEIRNAWLAAGKEPASLAEQESWYQQEQIRLSKS